MVGALGAIFSVEALRLSSFKASGLEPGGNTEVGPPCGLLS